MSSLGGARLGRGRAARGRWLASLLQMAQAWGSGWPGGARWTDARADARDAAVRALAHTLAHDYGPPVIVIGMHRSGTSLVARLLRAGGGYLGAQLDMNSEAIQLTRLNDRLLRCFASTWRELPDDLAQRRARATPRALADLLSHQEWLWQGFFARFGELGEELGAAPPRLPTPRAGFTWPAPPGEAPFWGWKDPRNTLTLAIWLRLFPEARVLHVLRNGVDVALSLWRRALRTGIGAPQCLDLGFCFELWERYAEEGCAWRALGSERYHEVRYEQLLRPGASALASLLAFAGAAAHMHEVAARQIGRERPDSGWSDHRELVRQAARSAVFRSLGY